MNIELQKYKGKATRHTCPACGKKHCFVLYIDTNTRQPIHYTVGRCNRESSCGYHYTPKQYFESNGQTRPKFTNYSKPSEPVRPMGVLPIELVKQSLSTDSNFMQFLGSLFNHIATIERLFASYFIGATRAKEVIFWQIDERGSVRTGKIMQYDSETGKRSKKQSTDWIHSRLIKSKQLLYDYNLKQCFFGQHLLSSKPSATVAIVESEKTAIIAAGLMPDFIWLAAGALQGLNIEKCECLTGRNVVLFPDLSEKKENRMTAFEVWTAKAAEIMRTYKSKVIVSDILERYAGEAERAGGFDIADYLINEMRSNGTTHQAPGEAVPEQPTPAPTPTHQALEKSLFEIGIDILGERNHLPKQALLNKMIQMYQIDSKRAEIGLKQLIESKIIEPTHIATYVMSHSTPF